MRKLRPVVDGEFWMIGPKPDLSGLLPEPGPDGPVHECVDHHIFQDANGTWHLWSCVRHTPVGRVLYHWRAAALTDSPWEATGEIIRADHDAGECIDDWNGDEWLQSPYVVRLDGTYFMFYGGHSTGHDAEGKSAVQAGTPAQMQICLMTSPDGIHWQRHRDAAGNSRVFVEPGETRDPCLIRIDGLWHMYYAGYYDPGKPDEGASFVLRTSEDLIHWSPWRLVHQDAAYGAGRCETECPHVVCREGYYYLFRTQNYRKALTHVFRSTDPTDFGVGDAGDKYVGVFPGAAVEIYQTPDGGEYVSSNHDPGAGTQLARLRWEADE